MIVTAIARLLKELGPTTGRHVRQSSRERGTDAAPAGILMDTGAVSQARRQNDVVPYTVSQKPKTL